MYENTGRDWVRSVHSKWENVWNVPATEKKWRRHAWQRKSSVCVCFSDSININPQIEFFQVENFYLHLPCGWHLFSRRDACCLVLLFFLRFVPVIKTPTRSLWIFWTFPGCLLTWAHPEIIRTFYKGAGLNTSVWKWLHTQPCQSPTGKRKNSSVVTFLAKWLLSFFDCIFWNFYYVSLQMYSLTPPSALSGLARASWRQMAASTKRGLCYHHICLKT